MTGINPTQGGGFLRHRQSSADSAGPSSPPSSPGSPGSPASRPGSPIDYENARSSDGEISSDSSDDELDVPRPDSPTLRVLREQKRMYIDQIPLEHAGRREMTPFQAAATDLFRSNAWGRDPSGRELVSGESAQTYMDRGDHAEAIARMEHQRGTAITLSDAAREGEADLTIHSHPPMAGNPHHPKCMIPSPEDFLSNYVEGGGRHDRPEMVYNPLVDGFVGYNSTLNPENRLPQHFEMYNPYPSAPIQGGERQRMPYPDPESYGLGFINYRAMDAGVPPAPGLRNPADPGSGSGFGGPGRDRS